MKLWLWVLFASAVYLTIYMVLADHPQIAPVAACIGVLVVFAVDLRLQKKRIQRMRAEKQKGGTTKSE